MYKKVLLKALLISLWQVQSSGEPFTCKDIESKSAPLRLRRHLFCDYDPAIRPTLDPKSTLNVRVLFMPKFVEMNEDSNRLNFHTWVVLIWKDDHLHWNPSSFEGINITHIKSDDVWVPEFSVFNSGDLGEDQNNLPLTDCLLLSDGTVECAAARTFSTHCPADFSNWPYDKHNCTLHFGSWMYFADEINFDFQGVFMHEFVESHMWDVEIDNLTSSSTLYSTNSDAMIFLRVGLERHSIRGSFVYITPAIALAILTLIVLWLDSRSSERIAVASVNFICHILLVLDVHWYLPSSGSVNVPKILSFYEISLIISACTLIFTTFLRKIHSMSVPAPRGIVLFTTAIINSPVNRFLNIENLNFKSETTLEDGENNHSAGKKTATWKECAIIFEWLALIIVTLTYIILICVILPASPVKPIPDYIY